MALLSTLAPMSATAEASERSKCGMWCAAIARRVLAVRLCAFPVNISGRKSVMSTSRQLTDSLSAISSHRRAVYNAHQSCPTSNQADIAQLGEHSTEDQLVPTFEWIERSPVRTRLAAFIFCFFLLACAPCMTLVGETAVQYNSPAMTRRQCRRAAGHHPVTPSTKKLNKNNCCSSD